MTPGSPASGRPFDAATLGSPIELLPVLEAPASLERFATFAAIGVPLASATPNTAAGARPPG